MHDLASLKGAAIAFDLDGTLVDTAPDLVGTLNAVLVEEDLPPLPFEAVRMMVGRGAKALLVRGFEAAGAPLAEPEATRLTERFIAMYLGRIARESRPFPQAVETLTALREAGAKLAVCTNKRTDLSVALLDALGMAPLFDAVIGADAAPAAKPDARHLFAAIDAIGGDRGRALLVGDSETDVKAARNAGLPVIAVSFGYTEIPCADLGADILIDGFTDLPAACLKLLA